MAANVTRLQMVERARGLANMRATGLINATEAADWCNIELASLYDELVDAAPPDRFSTEVTVAVAAGTVAYALPSTYRSTQHVWVQTGGSIYERTPLRPLRGSELGRCAAATAAYTVIHRYTPAPPVLTTDSDPVTGTFDGISGWDDLVVARLARRFKIKETPNQPVPGIETIIAEQRARVFSQVGKRDQGGIDLVTEVEDFEQPWPFSVTLVGYQLRAGYLDVYQQRTSWP